MRAYSVASANHDEHLEFFSIKVENGHFAGGAFDTAAFNGSAVNTATLGAATMPLNIWFSTPIGSTFPFACNGAIPLTCL